MRDHRAHRPAPGASGGALRRAGKAPGGYLLVLLGGAAAVVFTAGCAAIPDSGTPQSAVMPAAPAAGGSAICCQPIVTGPQPGWSPEQVVQGFLLASALPGHDFAMAREYLTSDASRLWHPPRSSVVILSGQPQVLPQRVHVPNSAGSTTVVVRGQELATLDSTGQYLPAPVGGAANQDFALELVRGRYLIDRVPASSAGDVSHDLLLSDDLFQLAYAPRNLYYYGLRNGALVPDPVFVLGESPDPARILVNDLLHLPTGWLSDSVRTAFPAGARLQDLQVFPRPEGGKTAVVSMTVPRTTGETAINAMATQIEATLTSNAYGRTLFQAVRLEINGSFVAPVPDAGPSGSAVTQPARSGAPVYYVDDAGNARELSPLAARGVSLPGLAQELPLHQIAVAPDGGFVAGIAGPASTVYTATLGRSSKTGTRQPPAELQARMTGASFTSLSWDSEGDLWVTGTMGHTAGVWVLPGGKGPPQPVAMPPGAGPVTALRIAPDGVRAAMISRADGSTHLLLGAVVAGHGVFSIPHTVMIGDHLSGVLAVSWFDEDHLLAVTKVSEQSGPAQYALMEVPTDAGNAQPVGSRLAGMMSVTADGPNNPLYLSLSTGRLEKSVGLSEPWTDVTAGSAPAYPG